MCELEIQLLHMVCGAWLGYQTRLSGWRGMMECVWLHHNLFSICAPNTLKLRQKKCCYQIGGGAVYERMHQDPTSRCNWSQPQLLGPPWRAVQTSINLNKSFLMPLLIFENENSKTITQLHLQFAPPGSRLHCRWHLIKKSSRVHFADSTVLLGMGSVNNQHSSNASHCWFKLLHIQPSQSRPQHHHSFLHCA